MKFSKFKEPKKDALLASFCMRMPDESSLILPLQEIQERREELRAGRRTVSNALLQRFTIKQNHNRSAERGH